MRRATRSRPAPHGRTRRRRPCSARLSHTLHSECAHVFLRSFIFMHLLAHSMDYPRHLRCLQIIHPHRRATPIRMIPLKVSIFSDNPKSPVQITGDYPSRTPLHRAALSERALPRRRLAPIRTPRIATTGVQPIQERRVGCCSSTGPELISISSTTVKAVRARTRSIAMGCRRAMRPQPSPSRAKCASLRPAGLRNTA